MDSELAKTTDKSLFSSIRLNGNSPKKKKNTKRWKIFSFVCAMGRKTVWFKLTVQYESRNKFPVRKQSVYANTMPATTMASNDAVVRQFGGSKRKTTLTIYAINKNDIKIKYANRVACSPPKYVTAVAFSQKRINHWDENIWWQRTYVAFILSLKPLGNAMLWIEMKNIESMCVVWLFIHISGGHTIVCGAPWRKYELESDFLSHL